LPESIAALSDRPTRELPVRRLADFIDSLERLSYASLVPAAKPGGRERFVGAVAVSFLLYDRRTPDRTGSLQRKRSPYEP